jgi:hypothetical protein
MQDINESFEGGKQKDHSEDEALEEYPKDDHL